MNFAKRAAELIVKIIADRRYLHSHAELSFEEHETTAYLVGRLEELGIPVQTFDDYTGCIATIEGGVMTKDLVGLWEGENPAKGVTSLEFLRAIKANLEKSL